MPNNNTPPYEPFGSEWEKELLKWKKEDLVNFLREKLQENMALKEKNQKMQGELTAYERVADLYKSKGGNGGGTGK